MTTAERACPTWCVNQGTATSEHAHVSADVTGGAPDQPLVARLIRMRDEGTARVLLNGRVATVDEAGRFLGSLRGLLDCAVPATPGLGFVRQLAEWANLSVAQMAEAAGLPLELVAAQGEGQAVLSVAEFELLALAVARRVSDTLSRTA